MKAQHIIRHKMNRTVYSGAHALNLVSIISTFVFVFSPITRSQTAEWTVYNTTNSGLPYNGVTGLAINSRGTVWIGTGKWNAWAGGGLAMFNGQNWTVYNTSNSGLPNNDHTGLAVDEQGNVWSGTESGLGKFDGQSWTVYNTSNSGLRHNLVSTPSFDEQGNLWIGSYGGGLAKFDGSSWTVYNTGNSGLPHNRAWATVFNAQGKLWIGTIGGGLAKFDGTDWTVYNTSNSGLPHNNVVALSFNAHGHLWIGTGRVVAKFDGSNWTVYNTANSGLPNNTVWDLDIDASGNIWVGTEGGLAKFDGVSWTVYKTSNSGLPDNKIYCLTIDAQDNVWIGTDSGGLAVYRPGEQRPIVDFNGDGLVDFKDLLRLIESWGQDDPRIDMAPPPFGDGIVDALDLELLMSYWDQPIDDPTLIAHWALDEAEGDVAYDSAGVNDAFVIGEPTWQPDTGRIGGALAFDGIDDCVLTEHGLNPSEGPLSVFAWVQGGAPGQVVISQLDGTNWLGVDQSAGCLMTDLCASGRGGGTLRSEMAITDGLWHRVGFVWDGVYRALYVDDILVAEDIQHGLKSSIGGLNIGCGTNSAVGTFWSGLIDDIRIYNRAVKP
jgi:sugar lactone lactonase YvrE